MAAEGEIRVERGAPSRDHGWTVANTGDRPVQVGSHYHFRRDEFGASISKGGRAGAQARHRGGHRPCASRPGQNAQKGLSSFVPYGGGGGGLGGFQPEVDGQDMKLFYAFRRVDGGAGALTAVGIEAQGGHLAPRARRGRARGTRPPSTRGWRAMREKPDRFRRGDGAGAAQAAPFLRGQGHGRRSSSARRQTPLTQAPPGTIANAWKGAAGDGGRIEEDRSGRARITLWRRWRGKGRDGGSSGR